MFTDSHISPSECRRPEQPQGNPPRNPTADFHPTQVAHHSLCNAQGAAFLPTSTSSRNDKQSKKPVPRNTNRQRKFTMQVPPTDGPSETPGNADTGSMLGSRRWSRSSDGGCRLPAQPNSFDSMSSESLSRDQILDSRISDDTTTLCPDPVVEISPFTNPFCENPVVESCKASCFSDQMPPERNPSDTLSGYRVPRKNPPDFSNESDDDESTRSDETTLTGRQGFPGHRDTLALIQFRNRSSPTVPEAVFQILLSFVSFDDYKALRLTCRKWHSSLPRPFLPITFNIPSEILQQVYQYLPPLDFDAARHTCRSWYLASLDPLLESLMLQRAGLRSAAEEDRMHLISRGQARRRSMYRRRSVEHGHIRINDCHDTGLEDSISEEWLQSKRLATEAKLLPCWRGPYHTEIPSGSFELQKRMTIIEEIDFSAVVTVHGDSKHREPVPRTFTVSACGMFVLVNAGCEILLYSLVQSIKAIARIPCGRRVLSVSMDTSSNRYTIAVLLNDRMGMCWDLAVSTVEPASRPSGETMSLGMHTDIHSSDMSQSRSRPSRVTLPCRRAEYKLRPTRSVELVHADAAAEVVPYNEPQISPNTPFTDPIAEADSSFSEWQDSASSNWPVETGLIAIYEHLGSPDDAPRSVAICPQRKCVAFGCRMGIELHWQDALTGVDLNRWFPLAAPSDHLYFLPRRTGFDSSKKLRLISSACGPKSTSSSRRGSVPSSWTQHIRRSPMSFRPDPPPRQQSMTRLFFGSLPFPSAATSLMPNLWSTRDGPPEAIRDPEERHGVLRTVDCEHYQAIPLSDGMHVMFTDPASGLLCIGSDAPIGSPTKLLRKFVLVPPGYVPRSGGLMPILYRAGHDLRWGVRIVATYGDGSFVLFNIPSDVFNGVKHEKRLPDMWDEQAGVLAQSDLLMDAVMEQSQHVEVHPNASTMPQTGNLAARQQDESQIPAAIPFHGVEIGRVEEDTCIEDLAVRTQFGGLRVWFFQSNGLVTCWDIYVPQDHTILRRRVAQNGLIDESVEDVKSSGSKGKGKLKEEDKHTHVRFEAFDGSSDGACSKRTLKTATGSHH